MNFVDVVNGINKRLPINYWYKQDLIWSTPYTELIKLLGHTDSIINDNSVYPMNRLKSDYYLSNPKHKKLVNWINDKIFTSEINQLMKDRQPLTFTSLVRLRIAVNMIIKLDSLKEEEKEEWIQHLQNIFHERHLAISKFYLEDIVQLPF